MYGHEASPSKARQHKKDPAAFAWSTAGACYIQEDFRMVQDQYSWLVYSRQFCGSKNNDKNMKKLLTMTDVMMRRL